MSAGTCCDRLPSPHGSRRREWRSQLRALGCACVIALSGCTSVSSPPELTPSSPSMVHPPTPTPSSTASPSASGALPAVRASASTPSAGPLLRDATRVIPAQAKGFTLVLGVLPDGDAIVAQASSSLALVQSRVGTWSGGSVRWFPARPAALPHQAFAAAEARGTVVWRETPSTTLDVEPWRILATTLGSGTVRVVALSSSLTGDDDVPPPPGVQVLATDGVTAWWTAPYLDPTGYRGVATRVVGASVKSEKATPVVVADHAYLPVVAGGQVVVLRSLVSDRASGDVSPSLPPLTVGDGSCTRARWASVRRFGRPVGRHGSWST